MVTFKHLANLKKIPSKLICHSTELSIGLLSSVAQ
jgi:hypothetical protein